VIRGDWEGAWEGIKATVGAIWDQIQNIVGTAIRAVKEVVLTVARALRDALAAVWDGIKEGASRAWEAFKDVILDVWSGIVSGIKSAVNLAIDAINALIRGMNKISGGLDFIAGPWLNWGDIPQIPKLARGGTLATTGLALVGERGPELLNLPRGTRVHNAEETRRMLGGSTVIYNNTFNVLGTPKVDERALMSALRRAELLARFRSAA
jgi:phage-related protein